MNRRGFLLGALAAPAVITTPGLLMPVRKLIEPEATGPDRWVLYWWEKRDGEQWKRKEVSYDQITPNAISDGSDGGVRLWI